MIAVFRNFLIVIATGLLMASCTLSKHFDERTLKGEWIEQVQAKPEPDWIQNPPQSSLENLYFVGLSSRALEEQEARNKALIDATNQFVKYCGVDVEILDRYLAITAQTVANVLDPKVEQKREERQRAEAFVRRVKADQFYTKRFNRVDERGKVQSEFEVYVLIRVPQNEFHIVQELRRAQRKRNEEHAQVLFAKARLAFSEGKFLLGLNLLKKVKAMKGPFLGETFIEQAEILEREAVSNFKIIPQSPSRSVIEIGHTASEIKAKAVLTREGSQIPVIDTKLVLFGLSSKQAMLNDGKSLFSFLPGVLQAEGTHEYWVAVDPNQSAQYTSDLTQRLLDEKSFLFLLEVQQPSVHSKAKALVEKLEARWVKRFGKNLLKVTMGAIVLKENGTGSVFIQNFSDLLAHFMDQSALFVRQKKEDLNKVAMRGFLTKTLQRLENVTLSGFYFREKQNVVVVAELRKDEMVLASDQISLPLRILPESWTLFPSNFQRFRELDRMLAVAEKQPHFEMDLWLNKAGRATTYQSGDQLIIGLQSQRDCYLKIYLINAALQAFRLFPMDAAKKIQKGKAVIVPNEKEEFTLGIDCGVEGETCGSERVLAVCSTNRPEIFRGNDIGYGIVLLDRKPEELVKWILSSQQNGVLGESAIKSMILTTIQKQKSQ